MSVFTKVSDANLMAFTSNGRNLDLISRKQEILDKISLFHNLAPSRILFVGFSSFLFAKFEDTISITNISTEVQAYLKSHNIKFKYIPETDLSKYYKKFQVVVAVDEYFTYAKTDQDQKDSVAEICNLATDYVITTLRDYKNQDYKDREFSQPIAVKNNQSSVVFLESHSWDIADRASWASDIYGINQTTHDLTVFGKFDRRTMYFKQLANFSATAGAASFLVHKDLMYKGLTKKNYEHVITIKFD